MALAGTNAQLDVGRLLQEAAVRHRAGDLEGAVQAYRKALRQQPKNPDALHLLGLALWQKGEVNEGLGFIRKALERRDDFPEAHQNAATIFLKSGDLDNAERHLRRALHHRPSLVTAQHTLGTLLREKKQMTEAAESFRAALRSDPRHISSYVELARTFRVSGDIDAMAAAIANGLAVTPDHPTLRLLSAEAQFAQGQLKQAWQNYRWRFQSIENRVPAKNYPLPYWDGSDLSGKSILIWTEQAPGDEIMFANMFADVIASAKRCVIQCSARLAPLFQRSFSGAEVIGRDLIATDLAGIDLQCAAGDLGAWLRPTFDAFPNHNGYLKPNAELRDRLRAQYRGAHNDHVLVGIAWRSAKAENAAEKSLSVLDWGPILNLPGVTFVNLQYGDCATELEAAAKGFAARVVYDAQINPLGDLDAYAAQVAAMDFVVSSSNTAAHVAGALGVPTICMLPRTLGRGRRWYWFADQPRCPWYPSVTLLSQRSDTDWLQVLRDAGLMLLDFIVSRGAVSPAGYLTSMAKALSDIGRAADAEVLYRRLQREPGAAAAALHAIGTLRKDAGDPTGALQAYDEALGADPTYWRAYVDAGVVLSAVGRFEDAIEAYRKGLVHNAKSYELLHNLGNALRKLGRSVEAVDFSGQALAAYPADGPLATRDSIELNYSGALDDAGRLDEALVSLDRILARSPEHVGAHLNRSQLFLSTGRFAEGWRESAWRLKMPHANVNYEAFPQPRWNGEDLRGKKILAWTEQGIGDEILLASMIPEALSVAKQVTLLCSDRLIPIFRRSFPQARVECRKEPLPKAATSRDIDFQMSLSDLGAAFRQNWDSFPSRKSFLVADTRRRDALRKKYTATRPGAPVIGLCWSSLKNYEVGWLKSVKLSAWAPILATPNVTFVSLQYGDREAELEQIREQLGIDIIYDRDVDALTDMDDFAAQAAAMDLVISISNTTVHAAAALGVPVWVMLAEGRGRLWYWFRDRSDSPWYPTVRLFRQEHSGEWDSVIGACAAELHDWTMARGPSRS